VLGTRALQISMNAPVMVDLDGVRYRTDTSLSFCHNCFKEDFHCTSL
jgi:hypothetical protein